MMKWGTKKSSHSLPGPSLINHVLPSSWLKKLKLKSGGGAGRGTGQAEQKRRLAAATRSSSMPAKWKEGRFYGGTDDLYWRLSFGDENFASKKGSGGIKSIWYESDDDAELDFAESMRRSRRSRSWKEDVREVQYSLQNVQEQYPLLKRTKASEQKARAPIELSRKDQELRTLNRRALKEKNVKQRSTEAEDKALQSARKDVYEVKQWKTAPMKDDNRRQRSISCPSCSLRMIEEACVFDELDLGDVGAFPAEEFGSDRRRTKYKKNNEQKSKNRQHRSSIHVSRRVQIRGRKQNCRKTSSTQRSAAKTECKIRAIEGVKKEKSRNQKKGVGVQERTAFDGYAVVTNSFDPQQDFRDSMLEMIIEKGIKQPEELEDLLVCYLTYNCDEYHDLIIKVFRQVWFDLNQVYYAANL